MAKLPIARELLDNVVDTVPANVAAGLPQMTVPDPVGVEAVEGLEVLHFHLSGLALEAVAVASTRRTGRIVVSGAETSMPWYE